MKLSKRFYGSTAAMIAACLLLAVCAVVPAMMPAARETLAPYYSAQGAQGRCALMFNVYQNGEQVRRIADILEKYGVRASFFIGGSWAEASDENASIVLELYQEGHDIGNHGYLHRLPTQVGEGTTREEIRKTDAALTAITGERPTLYAPPSGDFNARTVEIAAEEGYVTVLWSADTIDWRDHDAALITSRALEKVTDGGFILMHPTQQTADALPAIIEGLARQGYAMDTVSALLEGEPVATPAPQ